MTLCEICGKTELYTDNGNGACVFCWVTGRYFTSVLESDERANLLPRIKELEGVVSADIWHAGENAFAFAILLADGRIVTPGAGVQVDTEVGQMTTVFPMIPMVGNPWSVMVSKPEPREDGVEWGQTTLPGSYSDDGLVELIAGLL